MRHVADRLGEAVRSQPLDLVEGEFGTGGVDEVVVVDAGPIREFDAVVLRLRELGAEVTKISEAPPASPQQKPTA